MQSVTFQLAQNLTVSSLYVAGFVQIIHANQPQARLRSCLQVASECGEQRSQVQRATGSGRESSAIAHPLTPYLDAMMFNIINIYKYRCINNKFVNKMDGLAAPKFSVLI